MAGSGHERTAESTGLLLAAAVVAGDAGLFARAHDYYLRFLRDPNGLARWKMDPNDRPFLNDDGSASQAPIDELRIDRALLAASERFGDASLGLQAQQSGAALLAGVRDGMLTDDVSWRADTAPSPGDTVAPAYLDTAAMKLLAQPAWSAVASRSLDVLRGAAGPSGPPRVLYSGGRYACDSNSCETIPGLWIGLRLLDAGDRDGAARVAGFYLRSLETESRVADAYTTAGLPSPDEDLASYALLARLAWRLGDAARASQIVRTKIAPGRVRAGELAGLYTLDPGDAASFDNLEILLTLGELAGLRPPAD